MVACDLEPDKGIEGADVQVGPPGCPTNWLPVEDQALALGLARVNEGALVLGPGADEVEVRSLLGGQPVEGRRFVLRLEFSKISLGDDGKLEVALLSPIGPLASFTVQNEGAVLVVDGLSGGEVGEHNFVSPPDHLVVELESRMDLSITIRGFLGAAARNKVLALGVDRFEGGLVTPSVTLSGRHAEARLDRYAKVDPTGGVADDFACNTLGTAFDLDRWPAGRLPNVGGKCTHEFECGAGERCDDGLCRLTCLSSSECPGSICLIGAGGGFCRLEAEASCDKLPAGFVCGPDGSRRLACTRASDCPSTIDMCIGGACVSNDEVIDDDRPDWGTCPAGVTRCTNDKIQLCDLGGPGWTEVTQCGQGQCRQGAEGSYCDDCLRTCQDGDIYEKCGGGANYTLATDCRNEAEFCSTGDTNKEAPHCRPVLGPKAMMPSVPLAGGFSIDATEVTRSQYIAFLATHPNPSAQPPECAWNKSFEPRDWPWFDGSERAAQVDFCDAQAYCAFAGKHLCGAGNGGPMNTTQLGKSATDRWYSACSSGGANAFPYGAAFEPGRCATDSRRDVGSSPGCTSTVSGWTGVFDMVGGVGEWIDACSPMSGPTPDADSCRTRGTSASEPCDATRVMRRDSTAGIRCCD